MAENGSNPPADQEIPVEDQRRVSELYDELNRIDYYRLLGVTATADAKEIKRAYFALARQYHPDRWFRRATGALRTKIEAIFVALTNALETLTDPERRVDYDAQLREALKSRLAQRQAAKLEAEGDWASSAKIWSRVSDSLPTNAYIHHRYAYALLCAGLDDAAALEAACRAIELDATRAEYRVTAASLYLATDRDQAALTELSVACELDPERRDLASLHHALSRRIGRAR